MLDYFCFFQLSDPTGVILYVSNITQAEADIMLASNPALGYARAEGLITSSDYYIDRSSGSPVVTPRSSMPIAVDRTVLSANGIAEARIVGLPPGTFVTLLATADFDAVYDVIEDDGEFILKTIHKLPHVLRFELDPWLDTEVTIYGV